MIWDGLANARGGQRAMQCLAIQWNTMQCLAIQRNEGRGATYNTDSRICILGSAPTPAVACWRLHHLTLGMN